MKCYSFKIHVPTRLVLVLVRQSFISEDFKKKIKVRFLREKIVEKSKAAKREKWKK